MLTISNYILEEEFKKKNIKFMNKSVDLEIDNNFPKNIRDDSLKQLIKNIKNIQNNIVKELYVVYVSSWARENPVSKSNFIRKIKPTTVVLENYMNKPAFQIWFDDGNLFLRHGILVEGYFKKNKLVFFNIDIVG